MNDAVCGSTNGQKHPDRIFKRFSGHDLVWHGVGLGQADSLGAGQLGHTQTISVNCGNGGAAGKTHPERFRDTGHCAGSAHHRTRAGGHGEVVLDLRNFRVCGLARTVASPEPAAIGASTEPLAAISTRHHGSRHELNGGNAG